MRGTRSIAGILAALSMAGTVAVGPGARVGERRGRIESTADIFNRARPRRARPKKDPSHPALARAVAKRRRRAIARLWQVDAGGWHCFATRAA